MNSVSKPDYTDKERERIEKNIEKARKYRRQEELAMKERIEKDVINNSIKTEEPPAAEKQAAGPVVAEPPEAAGPVVAEKVAKIEEVIKRQNEEKEAAENQTSAAEEMRRKATEAERLPPARLIEENITNGLSNDETRDAEPVEENTPSSTGAVRINEPSKQTVYIKVREPSETVSITANEPSETVRITVREPSETVRITVREPSTDIVQIKVKEPYETVRITVSEPSTNPSYGSILKSAATSVATSVASVASVVSSAFASKSTPSEKKPEDFSKLPILQSDISVTTENITSDGIRNPVYKSVTVYDKEKKITTKHYKISKLSEDEIKKYDDKPPVKILGLESESNTRYVYIDRSKPVPVSAPATTKSPAATSSPATTTSPAATSSPASTLTTTSATTSSPASALTPTSAATSTVATTPPGKTTPTNGILFYLDMSIYKEVEGLLEKMNSPDIGYFLVKLKKETTRSPILSRFYLITRLSYEEANQKYDKKTSPPALKSPTKSELEDFLTKNIETLFSYKSDYFQKELILSESDLTKKFAQNITDAKTKPAIYTEI